jgi:hypothetical protein
MQECGKVELEAYYGAVQFDMKEVKINLKG